MPQDEPTHTWRKMSLTAEEARLRDTTALTMLASDHQLFSDLRRLFRADFSEEEKQAAIERTVDVAYRIADVVLERRQK